MRVARAVRSARGDEGCGGPPPGAPPHRPSDPRIAVRFVSAMLTLFIRLLPRALASPSLARALLLVVWRFRRNRWWARPPFVPLPARDYVRWRMYTVYGDHDAVPPLEDLIRYARWAARFG